MCVRACVHAYARVCTCVPVRARRIVRQYRQTLNPDLVCAGEPQQSRSWMIIAGCVFITLVLVVWRWNRGTDADEAGLMSNHSSRRSSLTQLADRLGGIKSPVGGMRMRGF